jgi:hypothetical protein
MNTTLMSTYNQRSWGSMSGDRLFSAPSLRVLPGGTILSVAISPFQSPPARPTHLLYPITSCSAPSWGALLRDGLAELHPTSLVSRDSRNLWGPFWLCDSRSAHGSLGCLNRRNGRGGHTPAVSLCPTPPCTAGS